MDKNYRFPISKIHPIIIPNKRFIDAYGNHCSYSEMNPSMYIDDLGNVTILVRHVNYRKYADRTFTVYGDISESIYSIMTGKIKDDLTMDLNTFDVDDVSYDYTLSNLSTYKTYWKGLEDIRFINKEDLLITIPECNKTGNPAV